jgi:hypothetical protein
MRKLFLLPVLFGLAACHAPQAHGPRAFTVEVALTPAAAAKLSALHEKVAVAAYYSGAPAPGAQADQDGQVDLGSEKVEFTPPQGQVSFSGAVIDEGDLKTIAGPPRVLINVFSARHVASDNLLDCGTFEDTIATAQAHTPHITCDLIKP